MRFTTKLVLGVFAVAALAAPVILPSAWAQGGDVLKASVARLLADTGVWHAAKTGKTPGFVADPSWPQPLPHRWLLGQVGGLYVDRHDHIWVYNRPRTMTSDEAAAEGAAPGLPSRDDLANFVVLLDLKMPRVDGFEVLRRLKETPSTAALPVIVLTTTDDPREIDRCYELGCNVYITKPVEYDAFIEAVRRLGFFLQVVKLPPGQRISPQHPAR